MQLVGRRTYAVCITIMALALCQKFLGIPVPNEIFVALFGLAVCFLRAEGQGVPPVPSAPSSPIAPISLIALIPLLPLVALLSGCALTYNTTPIMSESGGETVVSDAVNIKLGIGTKEATSIGSYKLSSDGGLELNTLDSKSDSSGTFIEGLRLGAQLGSRYLQAKGLPAGNVDDSPAADLQPQTSDLRPLTSESSSESEAQVVYSTDGYGGTPGFDGSGVYGRPNCSRCRAYKAAHPEVQIINLDDAARRNAMWDALRRLGFTGTTASLPVLITSSAYTLSAR